jgi:hypothetical protein
MTSVESEDLRILIRQKLKSGRLPYDSMPRFWGGPGPGEGCDGCNTPITHSQLVMEGIASTYSVKKPMQLHVKCFYIWDVERRTRQE